MQEHCPAIVACPSRFSIPKLFIDDQDLSILAAGNDAKDDPSDVPGLSLLSLVSPDADQRYVSLLE